MKIEKATYETNKKTGFIHNQRYKELE